MKKIFAAVLLTASFAIASAQSISFDKTTFEYGTVKNGADGHRNFTVKNIGSTRMSCESMEVETTFLKMLGETDHYVVSDNMLELYKGNLLLMKLVKM